VRYFNFNHANKNHRPNLNLVCMFKRINHMIKKNDLTKQKACYKIKA